MSNVLYLDDSPVAGVAMKGILARAHHRCVVVETTTEAWERLFELVQIDVVIMEPQLKGENGMVMLQRLRAHSILKDVPVVVYSQWGDKSAIQQALELGIQGYFMKPFEDAVVQRELQKAAAFPWRSLLFEEEKSFCAQMGIMPADLRGVRQDLVADLERNLPALIKLRERQNLAEAIKLIEPLVELAEGSGVWAIANCLQDLRAKAEDGNWAAFEQSGPDLEFARQLTLAQLNPGHLPAGFLTTEELAEKAEAAERMRWLLADAGGGLPLADEAGVKAQLERLAVCPAVESAAAAFAMKADGKASSLSPLMDLTARDPGLAVLVLLAANQLPRVEKIQIEDPRAAVALLGEIRLRALSQNIPAIPTRYLKFPPFGWPEFWMFQVGAAHLSRFICEYLEMEDLTSSAHALGLTHDVGKLLLASLFPFASEAAAKIAKDRGCSFEVAVRRLVGMSTGEIGSHFARTRGLPEIFADVMSHLDEPENAGGNAAAVAVVGLARHLCLQHRVGHNGEILAGARIPLASTNSWKVLRVRAFPSFDLRKFESAAQALCLNLKPDLLGRDHAIRTAKG